MKFAFIDAEKAHFQVSAIDRIAQLLDVERIAQGKLELVYGRYELSELCRDSAEAFAPVAANVIDSFDVACGGGRTASGASRMASKRARARSSGATVTG